MEQESLRTLGFHKGVLRTKEEEHGQVNWEEGSKQMEYPLCTITTQLSEHSPKVGTYYFWIF